MKKKKALEELGKVLEELVEERGEGFAEINRVMFNSFLKPLKSSSDSNQAFRVSPNYSHHQKKILQINKITDKKLFLIFNNNRSARFKTIIAARSPCVAGGGRVRLSRLVLFRIWKGENSDHTTTRNAFSDSSAYNCTVSGDSD